MKTLTKIFMLATLMVNSVTLWAASLAEPTSEQQIEQAYNTVIKTKTELDNSTSKLGKNTLGKKLLEDVNTLENACKSVCKPVASGKKDFCEKHCKLDKHGYPVALKKPKAPAKEEEHKEAAA